MLKRRTLFIILALVFSRCSLTADEESELAETMMKQIVGFAAIALEERDPDNPGICYAKRPNEHNQTPCYPLAYLYKTEHPLNPYYAKKEIRDAAVAICDYIAGIESTLEWPLYSLCQVYELLEDELDPDRRKRWRDYAEVYVNTRGIRPYFYTSFNHEAWNAVAVLRAGQVFARPDWQEQGRRLMHQLLKVQTGLGYFDEGPHHGPSMKYNQTQLAPMLLFADYAGDEKVLAASKKLADFMIRYSFPDGSPMGTFDGRQSWSLGYYGTLCYGLDRWPEGKEHNRRIYRTRKKWGILDPRDRHYNFSDWYAYFGYGFLLDEYLSLRPEAPSAPLPQDSDGWLIKESGPSFDGGAARRHGWITALSAINSDIPRVARSVYRLERQSRLDLWHEKTGLLIGGGHNMRETDFPLANFVLLTGYPEVACDFGRLSGGDYHDKRAVYIPRSLEVTITPEEQRLRESFGQGDLWLASRPQDEKNLELAFEYDVFTARELFVQLPLIAFFNSRILVDGEPFDGSGPLEVKREVRISNPTMGTTVRLTLPGGLPAKLNPGVWPLRWYGGEHPPQRYEPYYKICLLSVRVNCRDGKGGGKFMIEIVD